jgi:hypothetical protein
MSGGWTVEQWLAGFEQNLEGHVRQVVQTASEAAPADDPAWSALRAHYRVAADPLLARWVASLNPARPRGASVEELRGVLEAAAAWARSELFAFGQQAAGAAAHPIYARVEARLSRLALDEAVRYREALVARALHQPPPGAAPAVGGIFANAARTAQDTPWAAAYQAGAQTASLICPHCGGAQERSLDFTCRYCRKPLGQ